MWRRPAGTGPDPEEVEYRRHCESAFSARTSVPRDVGFCHKAAGADVSVAQEPNMRIIAGLILLAFRGAFGQSFEGASVKPVQHNSKSRPQTPINPGRVSYTGATLRDLVTAAYGVTGYQVSGPDWLNSNAYDMVAKLPADTAASQIPPMLQKLLADIRRSAFGREAGRNPGRDPGRWSIGRDSNRARPNGNQANPPKMPRGIPLRRRAAEARP
jgi:hypothetical protein